MSKQTIYYTLPMKAPALATASLLPIFGLFAKEADIRTFKTDWTFLLAAVLFLFFFWPIAWDKQAEDAFENS